MLLKRLALGLLCQLLCQSAQLSLDGVLLQKELVVMKLQQTDRNLQRML